jgi:uncharacterized protein
MHGDRPSGLDKLDLPSEPRGHVYSINGSRITVLFHIASGQLGEGGRSMTVGSFLTIRLQQSHIIGLITDVSFANNGDGRPGGDQVVAKLDLLGAINSDDTGKSHFRRGITQYPVLGDLARVSSSDELRLVLEVHTSERIEIGHLVQDEAIAVFARVDELLRKHFALFGGTGVGKSSAVALILRKVMEARPNLRIFLIDAHNEYSNCFDDRAWVLNPKNLKLPFWLFSFEELTNVLFRGRSDLQDDIDVLAEMIPIAKSNFARRTMTAPTIERRGAVRTDSYTVDTPVPYRLQDLVSLIDERMGKLENLSIRMRYYRLIKRIEAVATDQRFSFMFDSSHFDGDVMVDVLADLFRLPTDGRSITVMQLSGFPNDTIDSVVSVVCRMAFDFGLWSDGAAPLLMVCEEAHRYAQADRTLGFEPSRKAIARIAKEGRKYGVHVGLVTQRPAELDSTIISQCSTLFAMRLANEKDQAIVGAAVADAGAGQLSFVPTLGTGEVIAFGEGVALPIRLQFEQLPEHLVPRAKSVGASHLNGAQGLDKGFAETVVNRWRGAMTNKKLKTSDGPGPVEAQPEMVSTNVSPGREHHNSGVENSRAALATRKSGTNATFGNRG